MKSAVARAFWVGVLVGATAAVLAIHWAVDTRPLFPLPLDGQLDRIVFLCCPFLWIGFLKVSPQILKLFESNRAMFFFATIVIPNALTYGICFGAIGFLMKLKSKATKSSSGNGRGS